MGYRFQSLALPVLIVLTTATSLYAGSDNTRNIPGLEPESFEKIRESNRDLYASLKSFVCREDIQRYKGNRNGEKPHLLDRVSATVSFESGIEHYTDILQNNHTRLSLSTLPGAWSEGEFGTLLQQTRLLLEHREVTFVESDDVGGVETALYRFVVPPERSPWDLYVAQGHFRIGFETDVWVSKKSDEIVKIRRKSTSVPAETRIAEIAWEVTLGPVDLNGHQWLLPVAAAYAVSYAEFDRREWNSMSFSNYHRYGSEVSLRFVGGDP